MLIRHPKGDLLIDAGFGSRVAEQVAMLPRLVRAPYQILRTVSEQLDASGYDHNRLLGVLVTHSHWDHVSGLHDLRVPVWINHAELRYAAADPDGKGFRNLSPALDMHEYPLNGPAYLGFPASFDVHGDGSVIVALAGGHTLGSVVVFVTLPTGGRYAFIGDLTWQLDGIRRRVERPWLLRKLADSDAEQVRQGLSRMIALTGVMTVVPAHDRDRTGASRSYPPASPPRTSPAELTRAWAESADRLTHALVGADLERPVRLVAVRPNGTISVGAVVGIHLLDTVVHTWDVATSLRLDHLPPDDLVNIVAAIAGQVPVGESRTRPGAAFDPPLPTTYPDPWIAALAQLGRKPCQ